MKERKNLAAFSFLLIAALILYFFVIPGQIHMTAAARAEAFSPDTFPNFITIVIIIASAIGVIVSSFSYIKAKRAQQPSQREPLRGRVLFAHIAPYLIFLLCLAYAWLFNTIGVIPATLIIPPVILFLMGCRKWQWYLILYAFSALLYVLFKFILMVPLR